VDATDHAGETALHWAVRYKHLAIVEALLAAGGNPLAMDADGETAISIAKQLRLTDMVEVLERSTRPGVSL